MRMGIERLVIALVALTGCARGDGEGGWRGSIDTLPNGTVVVRNEGPGLWDSAAGGRVVEDLRIGNADGEGPSGFNQIVALAVDGAGRLYVLERGTQEIRVFDSSGAFVRRLGRKGGGPGEMADASGMAWDRAGRLWVVDPANARFSVFDTAGRFVASHPRPTTFNAWPWPGGFDLSGRLLEHGILAGPPPQREVLVRHDSAMRPLDTIPLPAYEPARFELRREQSWTSSLVPYTPALVWRLDPRGFLWFGVTAPYRIYQRTLEGDTLRIVERAYEPAPVSSEEKDSAVARLEWFTRQGGTADRSRIPNTKPAFTTLFVDDAGYLWVVPTPQRGTRMDAMDAFDPDGRYLGRVRLPWPLGIWPPPVFRAGRLYTFVPDADGNPCEGGSGPKYKRM
jgi:6-bladed beta-propeller protein